MVELSFLPNIIMILMSSIVLSIQSSRPMLRGNPRQLAVVQTAVSTDLHLTPDVDTQSVREFESVEESVCYDCGTLICRFGFEESGIWKIIC